MVGKAKGVFPCSESSAWTFLITVRDRSVKLVLWLDSKVFSNLNGSRIPWIPSNKCHSQHHLRILTPGKVHHSCSSLVLCWWHHQVSGVLRNHGSLPRGNRCVHGQNWSYGPAHPWTQPGKAVAKLGRVEGNGGVRVSAHSEAISTLELPSQTLPGIPSLKQERGWAGPAFASGSRLSL